MDNSETFIKMSDCEEIQDGWNPEGLDFTHRRPGIQYKHGTVIWLPRQDQLQEMIEDTVKTPATKGVYMPALLIRRFVEFCCDKEYISKGLRSGLTAGWLFDSMEQLWLAFVMNENHKKIWDGGNWVKEK